MALDFEHPGGMPDATKSHRSGRRRSQNGRNCTLPLRLSRGQSPGRTRARVDRVRPRVTDIGIQRDSRCRTQLAECGPSAKINPSPTDCGPHVGPFRSSAAPARSNSGSVWPIRATSVTGFGRFRHEFGARFGKLWPTTGPRLGSGRLRQDSARVRPNTSRCRPSLGVLPRPDNSPNEFWALNMGVEQAGRTRLGQAEFWLPMGWLLQCAKLLVRSIRLCHNWKLAALRLNWLRN